MKIKDVTRIANGSEHIKNRDQIATLVELPCLEACYNLYDKNIFTYWSSANSGNPIAEIGIVMDCLDEVNTAHAEKLIAEGIAERIENSWGLGEGEVGLSISFPINNTDSVEDISAKLVKLTEGFKPQDVLYGRRDIDNSQNLVAKILGVEVNATEAQDYLECLGFSIDKDEGIIWDSKELAEKHKLYQTKIITDVVPTKQQTPM